MERPTRVFENLFRKALPITILFLISVAIAAYGGEYVWQEAVVLCGIFLVSGIAVVVGSSTEVGRLPLRLFLPLLLLATYSFLHGIVPLVVTGPEKIGLLPYSFDPVASLWNAAKILGLICLLGLCLSALRHRRQTLINGLVVVGTVFAVLGLVRFASYDFFPSLNRTFYAYELQPYVGFGTFVNQNHFATLMLMTLGLSIGLFFNGRRFQAQKLSYLGAGLLAWTALVLTASRAGIVASFFVVLALVLFRASGSLSRYRAGEVPKSRLSVDLARSFAGSILILLALIGGVLVIGQGRVMHRFAQLPAQIDGAAGLAFRRADVWEAAEKMIREHYIFGVGFGGFQYAVSQFIDISGYITPRQAHNDYLEFVASGGLIAAALGIWFVWLLVVEMSKAGKKDFAGKRSSASVGAICGIVGVGVHSLADFGIQYIGNAVFLFALIAVAITSSRTDSETDVRDASSSPSRFQKITAVILVTALCGVCVAFGVSRYQLFVGVEDPVIRIPFDAEYYIAKANRLSGAGDDASAAAALRFAVRLRNHDYDLWLRLAQLDAKTGNSDSADEAFRNAIFLAPLYGEPHFYYGLFLLQTPRNIDSINELVYAARRDRLYTDNVLQLIWGRTTYIPQYLEYLTTDGNFQTNVSVMRFLLEKQEYGLIVDLFCRVEFSDIERDMITRKLFEKRAIREASRIYHRQCQTEDEQPLLIDGDFEMSEVRKGTGFGWLLGEGLGKTNIGFDRSAPSHGVQSLKFMLSGEVRSAFLEQTVAIRANTGYTMSFSYKSRSIVSGGPVVMQVLAMRSEEWHPVAEVSLSNNAPDWQRASVSFESGETQAIKVILISRPCGGPKCPIYGELWVDDFRLGESNIAARAR
jgi:O-antigen ligase/tetratricopeptide (TPR) repeat protein